MKQKDLRSLTDSKTVKLNNSFEYIFFDLDGTLTDSQEGIVNSLRLGLEAVGIHKTDAELRVFIGPPLYSTDRNCGQSLQGAFFFQGYF